MQTEKEYFFISLIIFKFLHIKMLVNLKFQRKCEMLKKSKFLRFDVTSRDLLYKVIFQDPDRRNAVCWAEKYPETKEPDTLISFSFGSTQSQEKRPQGLDLGRSTASNQAIAKLRPRLQCQSSELQFYLLPKIWCSIFVVVLQNLNANAISGIWRDTK